MRLDIRSQRRSILEEELLGFRHQIREYFGVILVLFWKEKIRRISEGILEGWLVSLDDNRGGHGEDFGGGHSASLV